MAHNPAFLKGAQAWRAFAQRHPDYDPQNLDAALVEGQPARPRQSSLLPG
jgi:hypothetical protein